MQNTRFIIPAHITAKVDEIMAASRLRFGHDAFRMEDPPADPPPASDPPKSDPPPADPPADDPPGADALGDAGKKALDAMKEQRKAARDEALAEKARADALQAKLDGKEAEHAAEQAKRETERAALDKANAKILKSEVKAAAKGVLADPQDAYKFLDLDQFEVDDDGNVDEDAVTDALKKLVAAKPYLAAQGSQFGNADAGPRNEDRKSIDTQIAEAQKAGDVQLAIALKQQRAAELAKK